MNLKNRVQLPAFIKQENRPVQCFTEEYISRCQKMSLEDIVDKISELKNQFWQNHSDKDKNALKKIKTDWLLK